MFFPFGCPLRKVLLRYLGWVYHPFQSYERGRHDRASSVCCQGLYSSHLYGPVWRWTEVSFSPRLQSREEWAMMCCIVFYLCRKFKVPNFFTLIRNTDLPVRLRLLAISRWREIRGYQDLGCEGLAICCREFLSSRPVANFRYPLILGDLDLSRHWMGRGVLWILGVPRCMDFGWSLDSLWFLHSSSSVLVSCRLTVFSIWDGLEHWVYLRLLHWLQTLLHKPYNEKPLDLIWSISRFSCSFPSGCREISCLTTRNCLTNRFGYSPFRCITVYFWFRLEEIRTGFF